MQRLDLRAQFFRHGRPVRLVSGIELVAERVPLCVEHDYDVTPRVVAHELAQHRDDSPYRSRRTTLGRRQRRQRVKGAKQIGGSVDEDERFVVRHGCVTISGSLGLPEQRAWVVGNGAALRSSASVPS